MKLLEKQQIKYLPILKAKYPEVPWRQMYGLRNFAVHDYHKIDHAILWDIAQDHLPENKLMLQQIINNEKWPT